MVPTQEGGTPAGGEHPVPPRVCTARPDNGHEEEEGEMSSSGVRAIAVVLYMLAYCCGTAGVLYRVQGVFLPARRCHRLIKG